MANPFDDDYSYTRNRKEAGLDPVKSYTSNSNTIEDDVAAYEREIEKYMQASLESTQRSAQQLSNSEKMAENTIRDLSVQREKLERAESGLDDIHHTTQVTQRTLNSLKSVFGGFIKNKFSRAPKQPGTTNDQKVDTNMATSKSESHINKIMGKIDSASTITSADNSSTLTSTSRDYIKGTRWEAMDNQVDQNLDDISAQLSRLRNFGKALGEEVDDQNRMLDRIQVKAERNDTIVRNQDAQMRNLLR